MRDVSNTKNRDITAKDVPRPGAPTDMPVGFGANFNDDPVLRQNLKRSHILAKHAKQQTAHGDDADFPHSRYDYSGLEGRDPQRFQTTAMAQGSAVIASRASRTTASNAGSVQALEAPSPILHFLGYYVETVPDSRDEKTRVRKVGVSYFTEDDTIAVREAKQENSGIVQGNILSRQQVPRGTNIAAAKRAAATTTPTSASAAGGWLQLADLKIGTVVDIYGKQITLVDCDTATRRYLEVECGIADVPAAGAVPWPQDMDTYNCAVKEKQRVEPRRLLPTGDFDDRRAVESLISGGVITKHPPDDVRTAQQFLANRINERLTFFALFDDRERMSGDLHDVVIRYYLENDTVEICSMKKENAGRDPGNKLLNRQRVPSTRRSQPPLGSVTTTYQQAPYGLMLKSAGQFLTYDELQVGKTVEIFKKKYLIHDADAFTRKWIAQNGAAPLADAMDTAPVRGPAPKPFTIEVPAHIGFGSDEDSMQSITHLVVKPPKIDYAQRARDAGKVLLFRASLAPAAPGRALAPEDEGREFLVRFFLDTKEIEIQERNVRNSGVVGGRFLARGRYRNKATEADFQAADFAVGEVVAITGRNFLLTELDEKSRRVVLEGESASAVSAAGSADRVAHLIVALKEHLNAKFARAHEAFHFLCSNAGMVTPRDIQRFFEHASGAINFDEAVAIVNFFDESGAGAINFGSFCKMMGFANSDNMDEASNNIRAIKNNARLTSTGDEVSMRRALDRTADVDARTRTRLVRKAFVDKMVQRRGTTQEVFRVMCGQGHMLSRAALHVSLRDVLHLQLNAADLALLEHALYAGSKDPRGVSLAEFSNFIEDTP
jgi:hypothetical protein